MEDVRLPSLYDKGDESVREFLEYLIVNKKWWLMPIMIFLVLLGGLIVFTETSVLAPFIYTLF